MGLEISKRYSSYSFRLMSGKLYEDISYMVEYRLSLFLAIGQVLKLVWHFKILTI